MQKNKRDWHSKLKATLWVDRITPKKVIRNFPYRLVYGKEARLSIEIELPVLDLATQLVLFEEGDPILVRCAQLMELEEIRKRAMEYKKMQIKKIFERRARAREFHVGDMVLK